MWVGYEDALSMYLRAMILEWKNRDYQNNMLIPELKIKYNLPFWIGNTNFHSSHRSALKAKLPEWYNQFGWKEPAIIDYIWPV